MVRQTSQAPDMFKEWTNRKSLVPLPFESFTDLEHLENYLVQYGCDTAMWGVEPRTCSVAQLFCDLRDKQCALMHETEWNTPNLQAPKSVSPDETTDDGYELNYTPVKNLVRCVFNLRLRIINSSGKVLVEMENGAPSLVRWQITQVIDEDPIHAAERFLQNLTGFVPVCRLKECEEAEVDSIYRGSSLHYTPLQFEPPNDYSKFSTSFPTLETHYRVNTLTIELSQLSLDKVFSVLGKQNLVWIPDALYGKIHDRNDHNYEDDDMEGVVDNPFATIMKTSKTSRLSKANTVTHINGVPVPADADEKTTSDQGETTRSIQSQMYALKNVNQAFSRLFRTSSRDLDQVEDEGHVPQLRMLPWYQQLEKLWKDHHRTIASNSNKTSSSFRALLEAQEKFSFSEEHLDHFREWLLMFDLDTTSYRPELLARLLEELLSNQCELLVHRSAPKFVGPSRLQLDRALRIVKLSVFDARHGSPACKCTCGKCDGERRAVLQKFTLPVDPDTGAVRSRPGSSAFLVDPEYIVCVNQKVAVDELVLEVARSTVTRYFGQYKPEIAHVRMCTPIEESNMSPSYPGLQTTYYLHHVHVYLNGLPDARSFVASSHEPHLVLYWEWMDSRGVSQLRNRQSIIEYFVREGHGLRAILRDESLLLPWARPGESVKLSDEEGAEVERRSIMSMLARELRQAAKKDHADTVKYLVKKINEVGLNGLCDPQPPSTLERVEREGTEVGPANGTGTSPESLVDGTSARKLKPLEHRSKKKLDPAPGDASLGADDRGQYTLQGSMRSRNKHRSSSVAKAYTFVVWTSEQHKEEILAALVIALTYNADDAATILIEEYLAHHPLRSLEEFNMVLIAAALVNDYATIATLRLKLTDPTISDVSIRNASPVCVVPVIIRGHSESLRLILRMCPYQTTKNYHRRPSMATWSHEDSAYYALNAVSLKMLQLAYKNVPAAHTADFTVSAKHSGSKAEHTMNSRTGDLHSSISFTAFVRWHKNEDDEMILPVQASYHVQIIRFIRKCIIKAHSKEASMHLSSSMVLRTLRQQWKLDECGSLPSTMSWGSMLKYICSLEDASNTSEPLSLARTRVLEVALSMCAPDHPLFTTYLGKLLISIVNAAWDDSSEIGYELESKREIINFLEHSNYPLHTALLATAQLRKRATQARYFRNEYSTLSEWMEEQCKSMLDHCTTQVEANAMLFEKSRVENDSKVDRTPETETSSLFLAIQTKNESVVSSKWFQGTNKRSIWFYQWWRRDSYPIGTESLTGRIRVTLFLFCKLLVYIPVFCIKPFSLRATVHCKSLGINSAYFKFMQYTIFYCIFVVVVVRAATEHNLLQDEMGVQRVTPLTNLETTMYIWVVGFALSELQSFFLDMSSYFESRINKYDVFYIILFSAAFWARWQSIVHYEAGDMDRAQTSLMVSDSSLAAGSMVVVFRLTHLSSYHPRLGPLYESILKMSRDIYLFFFILVVIMMAAAVGYAFLLRRYGQRSPDEVGAAPSWASPYNAFWLLGKMLFAGEVPDDVVLDAGYDEIIWNSFNVVYLLVVVIVLTNLLIAMMNKTYERTHDSAMKVYLNGRMQLINDYADLPIVPPPLNIITAPFDILGALVSHFRFGNSRAVSLVNTEADRQVLLDRCNSSNRIAQVVPVDDLKYGGPRALSALPSALDTKMCLELSQDLSGTEGDDVLVRSPTRHQRSDTTMSSEDALWPEWFDKEVSKNKSAKDRILRKISRNNYRRKVRIRVMQRYYNTARLNLKSDAIPEGMRVSLPVNGGDERTIHDDRNSIPRLHSSNALSSTFQSTQIGNNSGQYLRLPLPSPPSTAQGRTRPVSPGAPLRSVKSDKFESYRP